MNHLETDAAFVVSQNRLGFVWVRKQKTAFFAPLGSLFKGKEMVESNLPFGKLDELGKGREPTSVGRIEIEA
ncbi:MAG: hypothetical protein PXY39_11830 [archaeon]|nr:hypothetical protein [archaeon]